MSSLLDILHKRQEPVEPEVSPAGDTPPPELPAAELRLAVDNGADTTEDWQPAAPSTAFQAVETPVADLALATEPTIRLRAPATPATPAAAEPAPEFLTSVALARRSRRSTWVLGGGLAAILMAVLTVAWVLQGATGSDQDSMFVSGGALPAAPAAPVSAPLPDASRPDASGVVQREEPVSAQPAEAAAASADPAARNATQELAAPTTDALLGDAPDWYDAEALDEAPAAAPEELRPAATIRISHGTPDQGYYPKLEAAWQAFRDGDYARSEALYREVLATDAANVDALLGVAAVAARGGRLEEARRDYARVLQLDPRNTAAVAALSLLPAAPAAARSESELKTLLRDRPEAGDLQFALGLRYVALGRWSDAQGAFFEAVRSDPANADYAFNLAVSLDQLGQKSAAATYYERALTLARGAQTFDHAAAENRLARLRATSP